jgi:hypothetical protein
LTRVTPRGEHAAAFTRRAAVSIQGAADLVLEVGEVGDRRALGGPEGFEIGDLEPAGHTFSNAGSLRGCC